MNHDLFKRIFTSIIIFCLSFFCISKGSYIFDTFILLVLSISLYEWHNLSKNRIVFTVGFFFFLISFLLAYIMRNAHFTFFILIILISIFSDIGGFVFGKIFKGPKLTNISPNKTYSGSIGSFVLSIIVGLVYIDYVDLSNYQNFNSNIVQFIFFILFLSGVNQIGDLIISYFKRLINVKNTGSILPGHGGLLDRIDGLVFTIPSAYIFI